MDKPREALSLASSQGTGNWAQPIWGSSGPGPGPARSGPGPGQATAILEPCSPVPPVAPPALLHAGGVAWLPPHLSSAAEDSAEAALLPGKAHVTNSDKRIPAAGPGEINPFSAVSFLQNR